MKNKNERRTKVRWELLVLDQCLAILAGLVCGTVYYVLF